ncbi:uncharacterized protein N7500_000839 [Penicillium coprophilum]|uniref:uncharacterized protein n=1 Tax=Penicillium coprophilum TaxID=36646 RepID=UPI00238B9B3C|nr:uncharacterized protein N7500_000839 [Penicillium coprophilum]KAJ5178140.1 hypothetical protein N7500_000839 [Penicillium coprophilum]
MPPPIDPETIYTKQSCIGRCSGPWALAAEALVRYSKGKSKTFHINVLVQQIADLIRMISLDRRTGESVAIKIIDVENAEDDVDDIIKEIAILSELKSPYVTKYHGSYLKGSHLWIIMEFCAGGSCHGLLRPGVIHEEYIAIILRELLRGLDYLHSDQKLHRDIKAANILLSASGQVKLADFGVSGQLSATMTKKNTFVGTPFWMAPEVIKQSGYDYKADIWSLGITAIELACGDPPYADIHPMKVLFLIPKNPPPTLTGDFSKPFKQFVELCLRRDPKERPSAKELLEHPFVKRAKRTSYLTELIERAERWQITHRGQEDDDEYDEYDDREADQTAKDRTQEKEDLWDFGTVRPVGKSHASPLRPVTKGPDSNARTNETEEWDLCDAAPQQAGTTQTQLHAQVIPAEPANPAFNVSPTKTPLPPSAPSSPLKQRPSQTVLPPRKVVSPVATKTAVDSPSIRELNGQYTQATPQYPGKLDTTSPANSGSVVSNQGTPSKQSSLIPLHDQPRTPSGQILHRPTPLSRAIADSLGQKPQSPRIPQAALPLGHQPQSPRVPQIALPRHTDPLQQGKPVSGLKSKRATANRAEAFPRPLPEAERATACGTVILPALRAAMDRRRNHLVRLEPGRNPNDPPPTPEQEKDFDRSVRIHHGLEKVAEDIARAFSNLHHWDMESPVDMGGGVDAVLDAFLEEVLVRLQPNTGV